MKKLLLILLFASTNVNADHYNEYYSIRIYDNYEIRNMYKMEERRLEYLQERRRIREEIKEYNEYRRQYHNCRYGNYECF